MTKNKLLSPIIIVLFVTLLGLAGINQLMVIKIKQELGVQTKIFDIINQRIRLAAQSSAQLSGDLAQDVIQLVISQGVPPVYGAELGIAFDQVQSSISVLKEYDPTYGRVPIALSGSSLQRYVEVGSRISCEYCCSAPAIIRRDGQAACGCAHSQAMRGLLAYLITNYGDQYTNDELLRELARWKGLFFPKQMIAKLTQQVQGSQPFTPDTASLVLGIDMPSYGSGSVQKPLPSEINNLPAMVGGC
jgi:hypothetical protein